MLLNTYSLLLEEYQKAKIENEKLKKENKGLAAEAKLYKSRIEKYCQDEQDKLIKSRQKSELPDMKKEL